MRQEKSSEAELRLELEVAETVAREAGALVGAFVGARDLGTHLKGDRDVVTAADKQSEALIVSRLERYFPDDGIVAEEGSAERSVSGRRWFVDPLDGTLNFSRSVPIWCISLSLFDGAWPIVGAVFDPLRDEMFTVAQGSGAYLNGRRLASSGIEDPSMAVLHLTVDIEASTMPLALESLNQLAPGLLRTRNIGSAALALAYVAAGRYDAMLHLQAHTWDYGAASLLAMEAGARVTDAAGNPYSAGTTAVLAAATPALHERLLARLPAGVRG